MNSFFGAIALAMCAVPTSADLTLEYDPAFPSLRLLGSDTGIPETLGPSSREVWELEGVPDEGQALDGDSWLGEGVAETFPDPFLGGGWGIKQNGSISVTFLWLGAVGETTVTGTGVPFIIENQQPGVEDYFRAADGMSLIPRFGVGYAPIAVRVVPSPGALALAPLVLSLVRRNR